MADKSFWIWDIHCDREVKRYIYSDRVSLAIFMQYLRPFMLHPRISTNSRTVVLTYIGLAFGLVKISFQEIPCIIAPHAVASVWEYMAREVIQGL